MASTPGPKLDDVLADGSEEEKLKKGRSMAVVNTQKLHLLCQRFDKLADLGVDEHVFVREGDLLKFQEGGKVEVRRYILLNDMLVWAKPNIIKLSYEFTVKNHLLLDACELDDLPDTPKFGDRFFIKDTKTGKEYILMADNPETKRKWLKDLRACQAHRHPGVMLIQFFYRKNRERGLDSLKGDLRAASQPRVTSVYSPPTPAAKPSDGLPLPPPVNMAAVGIEPDPPMPLTALSPTPDGTAAGASNDGTMLLAPPPPLDFRPPRPISPAAERESAAATAAMFAPSSTPPPSSSAMSTTATAPAAALGTSSGALTLPPVSESSRPRNQTIGGKAEAAALDLVELTLRDIAAAVVTRATAAQFRISQQVKAFVDSVEDAQLLLAPADADKLRKLVAKIIQCVKAAVQAKDDEAWNSVVTVVNASVLFVGTLGNRSDAP